MTTPAATSAYLGWLAAALGRDAHHGDEGVSRSFPAAPDDLVLGYATGYDAHDIAPFVRSLRAVFHGEVALVVDDCPDVVALLEEHDVRALPADREPGWVPHAVVARFAAFNRYLADRPHAGSVLLTDVRDVIFQRDPFRPEPRQLEVFVEGDSLGDHAFNMKYLRAVAGEAMAEKMASAPAVCVGTVMGPREAVVRFCRLVLVLAAIPRSEVGGAFGADQAACNLAVHLGLVDARICENFGRVATVGRTPGDALRIGNGEVTNPDGTISAIVHQHDRHPHLANAMHDRWGRGLEKRERLRPKGATERGRRLRESLLRRLPELR